MNDENYRKRRKSYRGSEDNYECFLATYGLKFFGLTKDDRYINILKKIADPKNKTKIINI